MGEEPTEIIIIFHNVIGTSIYRQWIGDYYYYFLYYYFCSHIRRWDVYNIVTCTAAAVPLYITISNVCHLAREIIIVPPVDLDGFISRDKNYIGGGGCLYIMSVKITTVNILYCTYSSISREDSSRIIIMSSSNTSTQPRNIQRWRQDWWLLDRKRWLNNSRVGGGKNNPRWVPGRVCLIPRLPSSVPTIWSRRYAIYNEHLRNSAQS